MIKTMLSTLMMIAIVSSSGRLARGMDGERRHHCTGPSSQVAVRIPVTLISAGTGGDVVERGASKDSALIF